MQLPVYPGDDNAAIDTQSGIYEAHYRIKSGDRILDLGAHMGFFSEMALSKVGVYGMVLAVEPHPNNYLRLVSRLEGRRNFFSLEAAAWNQDGEAELWNNAMNSGGHSLSRVHPDPFDHCFKVKTLDIGKYLVTTGMRPDFIKIDTEGAEVTIIKSLLTAGIKVPMAIEVHTDGLHKECTGLLVGSDFSFSGGPIGVCHATPR